MEDIVFEGAGWLGAVVLLLAYGLNSSGKMLASSLTYQGMNIFAGVCLVANTYYHHAIPSLVVNIIWIIIGFFAIWKHQKRA